MTGTTEPKQVHIVKSILSFVIIILATDCVALIFKANNNGVVLTLSLLLGLLFFINGVLSRVRNNTNEKTRLDYDTPSVSRSTIIKTSLLLYLQHLTKCH